MKDFFETLRSFDFWAGFCCFMLIILGAIAIIVPIVSRDIKEKKFVESGYEQVVFPGSAQPIWQKVK